MASVRLKRVYKISPTGKAEDFELYKPGGLHPILIGDTFKEGRYRILHKLGFGSFSTVWLARDQLNASYVSLKITRADFQPDSNELKILRYLAESPKDHPGHQYVMTLKDDFIINGPNGDHQVFVTQVAGRRLSRPDGVKYNALGPSRLLASQMFQAVQYLHSLNIAHGDLYTGNIVLQLDNFDSWSEKELYECLGHPVTEEVKRIDSQPLGSCAPKYTVHPGNFLTLENRVLLSKVLIIDFGQAFYLNAPPPRITTPAQYSSPEVLYRTKISYATDLWALGCGMFEICAGYALFKMIFNPRQDVLKDMVAMLGKPPESMWQLWEERGNYFDEDGSPIMKSEDTILVEAYSLAARVHDMARLYSTEPVTKDTQSGEEFETIELGHLHDLLSKIMVYDPNSRLSLETVLEHPFLKPADVAKL